MTKADLIALGVVMYVMVLLPILMVWEIQIRNEDDDS